MTTGRINQVTIFDGRGELALPLAWPP